MKLYLVRDVRASECGPLCSWLACVQLEREAVRIHGALVNIEHERKRRHDQALAQKVGLRCMLQSE